MRGAVGVADADGAAVTAADLARIVHASRSFRRSSQLMPTAGIGRCRVSALDLAIRLRTERRVMVLEPEVFEMLRALAERGCVDRGDGGWAVTDWDRLGEVGAESAFEVPKVRRAKR